MIQQADDYKRQAEKRKDVFEKKLAKATKEKGLLIVNTGTGKGKTTAAFGMGLRVLGHGKRLGVVQFIKGAIESAERQVLSQLPNCDFFVSGEGYTWNVQDFERDSKTASIGWKKAAEMIQSDQYDMIILDELNVVLKHKFIDLDDVIDVCAGRPPNLHLVITGRHAPDRLIECADLVSEIKAIKHPYQEQGVKAQAGVEY